MLTASNELGKGSGRIRHVHKVVKCLQHQMNWGRGLEGYGIGLTQSISPAQKKKPRKPTNIFGIKSDNCTEMLIETPPQYKVAQLVEALHYKLAGRGFDFQWCHSNFFIEPTLPAALWPCPSRNEYQEYYLGVKDGRCVGLTTLPPSCADYLKILEPKPSATLRPCLDLCRIAVPLPHFKYRTLPRYKPFPF